MVGGVKWTIIFIFHLFEERFSFAGNRIFYGDLYYVKYVIRYNIMYVEVTLSVYYVYIIKSLR